MERQTEKNSQIDQQIGYLKALNAVLQLDLDLQTKIKIAESLSNVMEEAINGKK